MTGFLGDIFQQGYIVEDVATAVRDWAERVGAGPFYVLDRLEMDNYSYRGVKAPVTMRLAFGYWGPIQIELIQPLGSGTSLYSDAVKTSAGQLNHCATLIEGDLDELLAKHGLEERIIQAGHMPTGLKFVYLENYLPDGSHLELIQATDQARQGFQGMQAIHAAWDSSGDPVRDIANMGADMAALR